MRFSIFTLVALPIASSALAVTSLNERTPLMGARNALDKRRTIDEKVAIIAAGAAVISIVAPVATYISTVIKAQSDANTCGIISGSIDGVGYQYHAATTGKNCDTTSELKTIDAAVTKALNFMQTNGINQACFNMQHGGTWRGLLQLASNERTIINNKCDTVTFTLTI
ncbi:hypothetical protein DE146DRAFT_757869 [Phaeosphaeria sp. MPI-PUGE-AT-0046c]|nr:hypothetical protein DE146DRAFT_757869 [Phaeosphaeria sp. MPI-PUGE-AT-0046c]